MRSIDDVIIDVIFFLELLSGGQLLDVINLVRWQWAISGPEYVKVMRPRSWNYWPTSFIKDYPQCEFQCSGGTR